MQVDRGVSCTHGAGRFQALVSGPGRPVPVGPVALLPRWPALPAAAATGPLPPATLMAVPRCCGEAGMALPPPLKGAGEVVLGCRSIHCLAAREAVASYLHFSEVIEVFCVVCEQVQGPSRLPITSAIAACREGARRRGCP